MAGHRRRKEPARGGRAVDCVRERTADADVVEWRSAYDKADERGEAPCSALHDGLGGAGDTCEPGTHLIDDVVLAASPPLVDVPRPGEEIRLAEHVQEVVSRLPQPDLERALVQSARADALEPPGGKRVVFDHLREREREVARGDGRAVAPADVGAKRERVRAPVVGDGEAFSERGFDLEVGT